MEKKNSKTEGILYLVFGGFTTVINYGLFIVFIKLWSDKYVLASNMVAFAGATLFAYFTNKKFVFYDEVWSAKHVFAQFAEFAVSRLFSLAIEQVGLWFSVIFLDVGRYTVQNVNGVLISKIVLSFISVIINYIISKFWIFRKGAKNEGLNNNSSL